ncbi:MAG: SAM-dependent methyltransferase [Candidatus Puniceispirillaceae bacterium]
MSGSTSLNTQAVLSMKGSGYYSARTIGAKHAIESTLPLMLAALDSLPELPVLKLADYGAADGGTSQYMWSQLISGIRASGDNRPIEIIYTDLASNDFSTLFRTMQGMQGNSADAYQIQYDNVFVHGCGTGFHQQLMAPETLSLGFSATAMHYVSEKPCQITDHVHMVGANTKERAEFTRQAARDWERILLGRATELAKGGRFICMNFGIDEEGRYLGHTGGVNMFDRFSAHWAALRDAGVISSDEFVKATFAQHYRTVEEFTAPFSDPASAVSKAGLKLLSVNTRLTPCPFRLAYNQSKGKMSSAEFAATLIPTMRSWSETVFRTALEGRAENEIDTIIDQFYGAYETEVADNPDGQAMDYIHIILEIERA